MRLYTLTHFMLSPIAKGIQATHSSVELFNKYTPNPGNNEEINVYEEAIDPYICLFDWSLNHKTMISLNGGLTPDLNEMIEFLEYNNCPYPWAFFNEDESLGGLVTSISLVIPERIYDTAFLLKTKKVAFEGKILKPLNWGYYNENFIIDENIELEKTCNRYGLFDEFEQLLITRMNSYRLATV